MPNYQYISRTHSSGGRITNSLVQEVNQPSDRALVKQSHNHHFHNRYHSYTCNISSQNSLQKHAGQRVVTCIQAGETVTMRGLLWYKRLIAQCNLRGNSPVCLTALLHLLPLMGYDRVVYFLLYCLRSIWMICLFAWLTLELVAI